MTSFKQARDMFRIQKEAKRVKKELRSIHVEAEAQGVFVVVSAEMEVVDIRINPDVPHDMIAPRLIDALNRAFKKAQIVSAERMQGVMSQMGMGMPTGEK